MEDTDQGLADMIDKSVEDSRIEGKVLGKKYRIGKEIGRGGMGVVYAAQDTTLGREVVVKVINAEIRNAEIREQMLARFRREAVAASRVLHQNVAVIFSFEEIDGRHLLVQERIDGRQLRDDLFSAFGKPQAIEPKRAIRIAIGILKGLAAIHGARIVHRDLKPGNVMLTHDGDRVKILDFGLGKAMETSGQPALDMTLTQCGIAAGSPLYMAPEQIDLKPVDARADLYALGIILFQMLTGRHPFPGRNQMEVFDRQRHGAIPPLVGPNGPIDSRLEAVVHKAMAKTPEQRYASAEEMRAALEAVDLDAKPRLPMAIVVSTFAFLVLAVAMLSWSGIGWERDSAPAPPVTKTPVIGTPLVETRVSPPDLKVPPPPPSRPAPTVAQGCEEYRHGRTADAIATLTRALAKDPDDAEGLYCLCGATARDRILDPDERKACEAYLRHPAKDRGNAREVAIWLKLPTR